MKFKRIISTVLAVIMLMSACTMVISAQGGAVATEKKTDSSRPTVDYFTGQSVTAEIVDGQTVYTPTGEQVIFTAEDKLSYMDLRFEKDGYQLYVDEYSGEVATRCIATGEILFSNPYTIGSSKAQPDTKAELMSQLIISYTDISTGETKKYNSYTDAAIKNQIKLRSIKNGVRLEYAIGREESRMLVPQLIEKEAFETKILNVVKEAVGMKHPSYVKLNAFYNLQDASTLKHQAAIDAMHAAFPITEKMAVYALDTNTNQKQMEELEAIIKTYCPDYTYEELDEDHLLTEYDGEDKSPALFRMALEYTLDKNGLSVKLPANGIRFNEALYRLESIEIVPYMGAGAKSNAAGNFSQYNSGYTFFPDGSGTLFDFEKITDIGSQFVVSGKVYGQDYAYHQITGTHQEVIRYPVFGLVETEDLYALDNLTVVNNKVVVDAEAAKTPADQRNYKTRGYVAIVEEGDAMMELSSFHAVSSSEYNTVRVTVRPRPQDIYTIEDGSSTSSWTVVSQRKYTGDYKIRYVMLTDSDVAKANNVSKYYDCTYVGMARAYREYLEGAGTLTRLASEDVGEDIPLYIESFGALRTTERFLSIPMEVMTPLTTFEDIQTMRDQLAKDGIENINFILKGFTKGGLTDPQPSYNLKWEGAVDDEMDFEELLAYAKENGFGIFPDFDFAYAQGNGWFDGLSLNKHAAKTIDDRYTSKREYSATKQTYVSYYELAISPASYDHFYDHLTKKYLKYDPMGISVSTLGSALNSDFDEDDPYNREDSKDYTVKAFQHFAENYGKVMTSAGNAYSWKYVDYITDVALDSSRYSQSAASVPFLGMVLHGYVEIAGTPINMEGNLDYAILKAIENGASLKFILSYRNTDNLKTYETLSKYYSVNYEYWYDDVVVLYNEVNDALAGVQTSVITEHKFVDGYRVPDSDELLANAESALDAALKNELDYENAVEDSHKDACRKARLEIKRIVSGVEASKAEYTENYLGFKDAYDGLANVEALVNEYVGEDGNGGKLGTAKAAIPEDTKADGYAEAKAAYDELVAEFEGKIRAEIDKYTAMVEAAQRFAATVEAIANDYKLATTTYLELVESSDLTDAQKADIRSSVENYKKAVADAGLGDVIDNSELYLTQTAGIADGAYSAITAQLDRIQGEEKLFEADSFAVEAYAYESNGSTVTENKIEREEVTLPKYSSDTNKIVYEVYENGTTFLLNFNNYKVTVEINKVTYVIEAYGYVILSRGN